MNLTMLGVGEDVSIATDPVQPTGSGSIAAVVAALIPTSIVGASLLGIFVLVRHRLHILYAPRSVLGSIEEKDRTPLPRNGFLDWLIATRNLPEEFLLHHGSLESYLYLRFLRTMILICVVGCGLSWPILMPVNATGGGSATELDRLSISNVKKPDHLYAHAIVACVFLGFVLVTIARERLWLINLRRNWMLSMSNANCLSSRTVLFLSAPKGAMEQKNMGRYFGDGAIRVWPVTEVSETLPKLISQQEALVEKLESEEAALIRNANSWWAGIRIDGFNISKMSLYDLIDIAKTVVRMSRYDFINIAKTVVSLRSMPIPSPFYQDDEEDTKQALREQIREKGKLIEEMRKAHGTDKVHDAGAVFVQFETQAEAQWAYRETVSTKSSTLTPRYIGVKPSEVIWDNLTISPWRRVVKEGIALSILTSTVVAWSLPSGIVALVSNVKYLADNYEWLWFLRILPDSVMGLLSGLFAPLLTGALTKDIPAMYRKIFESAGGPTHRINELRVQKWFYVFQVTQVFLLTAVFSGATTVPASLIQDPKAMLELLASQLPKSSTFYLTYFIVQGIASVADNLLDSSNLRSHLSFEYWEDETPRQKFKRYTSLKGIDWGQVYPKFANFAIIAIAYSCIAPLVLGFAAAGLSLFYISYRYNLLYVMHPKIDTKGQACTAALQHLLTGVYVAELVLIGFFKLRSAEGPTMIAGLLFVVTVLYHVVMNRYMSPLEDALLAELVSPMEKTDETTPLLSHVEEGQASHAKLQQTAYVPSSVASVLQLMARSLDSNVSAFFQRMSPSLRDTGDDDIEEQEIPKYTEEDLERAYRHPALTSGTPVVWMARDGMGASRIEIQKAEECGLTASDEGAWLDEKRRCVQFDVLDFEKVPVWKPAVNY